MMLPWCTIVNCYLKIIALFWIIFEIALQWLPHCITLKTPSKIIIWDCSKLLFTLDIRLGWNIDSLSHWLPCFEIAVKKLPRYFQPSCAVSFNSKDIISIIDNHSEWSPLKQIYLFASVLLSLFLQRTSASSSWSPQFLIMAAWSMVIMLAQ